MPEFPPKSKLLVAVPLPVIDLNADHVALRVVIVNTLAVVNVLDDIKGVFPDVPVKFNVVIV